MRVQFSGFAGFSSRPAVSSSSPNTTTMKRNSRLLPISVLSLACAASGSAALLSTNTTLGVGSVQFERQDLVVSNCTVTIDGPHRFSSLRLGVGRRRDALSVHRGGGRLARSNHRRCPRHRCLLQDRRHRPRLRPGTHRRKQCDRWGRPASPEGPYGGFGAAYDGSINATYGDFQDPRFPGVGRRLQLLVRRGRRPGSHRGRQRATGRPPRGRRGDRVVGYNGGGGSGGGILLQVNRFCPAGRQDSRPTAGAPATTGLAEEGRVAVYFAEATGFDTPEASHRAWRIRPAARLGGHGVLEADGRAGTTAGGRPTGSPPGFWTPLGKRVGHELRGRSSRAVRLERGGRHREWRPHPGGQCFGARWSELADPPGDHAGPSLCPTDDP